MPNYMTDDDTEEYRGFTIRVKQDSDPMNPRDWDNFGKIWMFDRNYISPDEPPHRDPWESMIALYSELAGHYGYQHMCNVFCDARGYDMQIGNVAYEASRQPERFFKKLEEFAIVLPVYVYDHSGRTYSTRPFSCPWDSGQIGWTFISLADVRKEYGVKRITKAIREKATRMLVAELETYNQWASGDVWGYIVEDDEGDELDSCWGFYGMDAEASGLLEEARAVVDYHVEEARKAKQARTKTMIKNHVPLEVRAA